MKKAYQILSAVVSLILLGHMIYWAEALGFLLGTLFILGVPILFWFPASLISFGVAICLSKEKEKLKNVLYGFPILTLVLFYTLGEYYGP